MDNDRNKVIIRKTIFWGICLLAIGGMVFGMVKVASRNSPNDKIILVLENYLAESDWVRGNKEAKIVVTEYSDFQCPACASYYEVVKQLHEDFGDNLAVVYRHFPLGQHKNAEMAALSAEAAGKQNKFWEMHDMIFENQKDWELKGNVQEIFISYGEKLGLNLEQFKNDLDSKELKDKVEADYQSGVKAGVNQTPTFFLNGREIDNPRSYDEFKSVINKALN